MPRIFISHASRNNGEALALREWLLQHGWDDLFLDIEPKGGLAAGQRWLEQLEQNVQRCKGVLFLVSRHWLESEYCHFELAGACRHGRRIFPILLEDLELGLLPQALREVQLSFLFRGNDFLKFPVTPPADYRPVEVAFSREGLETLRFGLIDAGLTSFDTNSFPWPEPGYQYEEDGSTPRRPYRGLKAIASADAGVFFGRDAELVRALDLLVDLREAGSRRLVVLLGASGAGKSSFLRAGLLPRLGRDDRRFLPLPLVRPHAAPMWGNEGMLACLQKSFADAGLTPPPDLRADLVAGGERFLRNFAALLARATGDPAEDLSSPTLLIPLDQAEELFLSFRGVEPVEDEANLFLTRLAELLRSGPEAMVLVTIRSAAYPLFQSAAPLATIPQTPFNLPPLPLSEYHAVIDGPAGRAAGPDGPFQVDRELKTELIEKYRGADAMPLLALTLERLYLAGQSAGRLRISDYRAFGEVRDLIETVIAEALSSPGETPAIPESPARQEALLKEAFVPWLIGIDEATGEAVRRSAYRTNLPSEALPLIDRLVEHRLLIADRPRVAFGEPMGVLIEVAHEALFRGWSNLQRWVDQETGALRIEQEVGRSAKVWSQNSRGGLWLDHRGDRLREAEDLSLRKDFKEYFAGLRREYLEACRQMVDTTREEEERRLERQKKLQRRIGILLLVVAIVTLAGAWQVLAGKQEVARQRSRLLATSAETETAAGNHQRALRLALAASRSSWLAPASADAALELGRAAYHLRLETRLRSFAASVAIDAAADGSHLAVAELGGREVQVFRREGKNFSSELLSAPAVHDLRMSANGRSLFIAGEDGFARQVSSLGDSNVWRTANLGRSAVPVLAADFSQDGSRLITISESSSEIWRRDAAGEWQALEVRSDRKTFGPFATLSPDGSRLLEITGDGRLLLHLLDAALPAKPIELESTVPHALGALFSPHSSALLVFSAGEQRFYRASNNWQLGRIFEEEQTFPVKSASIAADDAGLLILYKDGNARLWVLGDGISTGSGSRIWSSSPFQACRNSKGLDAAEFLGDGLWIAAVCFDGSVQVLHRNGTERALAFNLENSAIMGSIVIAPDGWYLFGKDLGGVVSLWSLGKNEPMTFGPERRPGAAISPDGSRILVSLRRNEGLQVYSRDDAGAWKGADLEADEVNGIHWEGATFAPGGDQLLIASSQVGARIFEREGDRWTRTPLDWRRPLQLSSFSQDGRRLITATVEGELWVWTKSDAEWRSVALPWASGPLVAAAFSPNGKILATAAAIGRLDVWNSTDGLNWHTESLTQKTGWVTAVAVSPDGDSIALANMDGSSMVWTRQPAGGWRSASLEGVRNAETSIGFSPDGKQIVTARQDGTAQLWSRDWRGDWTGTLLKGHRTTLNSAVFSPDGQRIATASEDGTVRVWSHDEAGIWGSAVLRGFGAGMLSAVFTPDGQFVLGKDKEGQIWQWDVHWLAGSGDWNRSESISLTEAVCREKLSGLPMAITNEKGEREATFGERLLTADDLRVAPLLRGRQGEDVCQPFLGTRPWWKKVAFWR